MSFPRYVTALLFLAASFVAAQGADRNGYIALYEARAGNPLNDVDIATYVSQPCQQTIRPGDSESMIEDKINNRGAQYICVQPGTYNYTINITAKGTAGARKVLRYTRPGDTDDDPWVQGSSNRATFRMLYIDDTAQYWIIHRLTIDGDNTNHVVKLSGDNNILNRLLMEEGDSRVIYIWPGATGNTIQNSVIRGTSIAGVGEDDECVGWRQNTQNTKIINNEIYDCHGDAITAQNGFSSIGGSVVENNDLYLRSTYYSDGRGNLTPNGSYACAENGLDMKNGGVAGNPVNVIHNRIWGFRRTDRNCAGGSDGDALLVHSLTASGDANADYVLVQNNVVFDSANGISIPNAVTYRTDHVSIVGNLLYDIQFNAFWLPKGDRVETYLNTVINAGRTFTLGGLNNDTRCNVFINSGATGGTPGPGEVADENAFFNTAVFAAGGTSRNFEYTAASEAQASDYCFYRKLRTGPERICIPFAHPTATSPHARQCTADLGSRPDVGVNNEALY